jgi:Uncharacterised nucleotidyltransferase
LAAAAGTALVRSSRAARALDPEFAFLLACCRKRESDIAVLLESTLNKDRVLKLADHHRLLPVVCAALENQSAVPADIRSALRMRFQAHVWRTLRFSAGLSEIVRALEGYGIEVLSYKGPVLAKILFGDPAMRQFGDLDFLIRAESVPRARAALAELGYRHHPQLSARQERAYLRAGYEYVFGSEAGKNLVELQWQILPRFYSVPFEMESLFSRSIACEFDGRCVQMPGNEDLFLILSVHAAKHGWPHLGMLRDIANLAQFDLDWDWVRSEAQQLGILRMVSISLLLIRKLLRLDLCKEFQSSSERVLIEKFAAGFEAKLRRGQEIECQSIAYFRTMMQLRERWRDRARFAWRLAMTPSVGEWQSAAIPDRLAFLYHGMRAARLTRRLLLGAKQDKVSAT